MRNFDTNLGALEQAYRKAHILKKTVFVITADHGMMPVFHFIDEGLIDDAVKQAGAVATNKTFNTAAYVWLRDPTQGAKVAQIIAQKNDPNVEAVYYLTSSGKQLYYAPAAGRLVSNDENWANEYLLGTLLDGHQPTVVVLARAGATFANPNTHWKADHGGAGWQSQHIPLVLSGAGIRKGFVTGEPAEMIDIAPTVLTDMGVQPTGMEGQVLNEALLHPDPDAWSGRVTEAKVLSPLISAMIQQNAAESQ
jgi:arylsulfatase A-like enzyme